MKAVKGKRMLFKEWEKAMIDEIAKQILGCAEFKYLKLKNNLCQKQNA